VSAFRITLKFPLVEVVLSGAPTAALDAEARFRQGFGSSLAAIADSRYSLPVAADDRELWACALQVERQHGTDAPRFVAERIGALAVVGDEEGIATWKMIAERLDRLNSSRANADSPALRN